MASIGSSFILSKLVELMFIKLVHLLMGLEVPSLATKLISLIQLAQF
jgi:hypothetical protein